jgi:serine/threonine protein phosphatase 1
MPCNLIDLDTGAGWNGKLIIMDINSKQYWQSDSVLDLYPDQINARK